MFKIAPAVDGFGILHSGLASRAAKRAAAESFGERNRNGLYRVCCIGQSLVSFAVLADYIRRQPSRELYRVQGPLAPLMYTGQVAAVGYAISAANQVGIRRITGLESFEAWRGDGWAPPELEAQGPALDAAGRRSAAGLFAWSRHPLKFVPDPIFRLWPKMTTNLLALNVAATMYLVVGSWHEEARLRQTYGRPYDAYQRRGIPYYVSRPVRSAATPLKEAGVPSL